MLLITVVNPGMETENVLPVFPGEKKKERMKGNKKVLWDGTLEAP